MLYTLRTLNPKPAQNFSPDFLSAACIEVTALWIPEENRWHVFLNKHTTFNVRFDRAYYDSTKSKHILRKKKLSKTTIAPRQLVKKSHSTTQSKLTGYF